MFASAVVVGIIIVALIATAVWQMAALDISLRQALFYVPLKLRYRIDDREILAARSTADPVIYAVLHQSRVDPAIMLALLPEQTLHILDEGSARALWMEPYRALARTIEFNAKHVFVSRRLVRRLKGGSRLAVYIPEGVEPDQKTFRLFRAIARIASQANAKIVPIVLDGAKFIPSSLVDKDQAPRDRFGKLRIRILPGVSIAELIERGGDSRLTSATALFDYLAEARIAASNRGRNLFQAIRDAADRFGPDRIIIEDPNAGAMTYRRLFTAARILGRRFADKGESGSAVGLLLPNSNAAVTCFMGVQSAGRIAAMLNFTAGPGAVISALKTAQASFVVSSREFVEKAELGPLTDAITQSGFQIVWLEDVRADVGRFEKFAGFLLWRFAVVHRKPGEEAVILFTSGSEGAPKAVVHSHVGIITNTLQAEARIDFSPQDKLLNVLPVFHCFGLTGGTLVPLLSGVKLFLYPSPLHYKKVAQIAAKTAPTIMFGTDTFLSGYARNAKDKDFSSLRFVVAGAEPVRPETRRLWHERFNTRILEGYGMTEAAPVVAVNTSTHGRDGTVGRLLPAMKMRIEPVEGLQEGGRLWIAGPNLMLGYMTEDRPGVLQPLKDDWHDTGDIVSVDREGFITICGRAKRFAKLAGEMVSLVAVERLANSLWQDDRHAAFAVPDKRKGERIVLITTRKKADLAELVKHAKSMGSGELVIPSEIVPVNEIPVLGSGKIDHFEARKLLPKRMKAVA